MASKRRKDRDKRQQGPIVAQETRPEAQDPMLSPWQWKLIMAGTTLTAVGFFVLSKSDPAGRNWASHLSPLMILGGYVIVGFSLWKTEK